MTPALLATTLLCGFSLAARADTPVDTPAYYSHAVPLTVSGKNALVQVRLPPDVYRHARSRDLNDLRVFDAAGKALPFALLPAATATQTGTRALPAAIFPVYADAATLERDNVEIRTAQGGTITAITTRADSAARQEVLSALVLDFGPGTDQQAIDALVFTPPSEVRNYAAQVTLEVSDDLRTWETLGYASLSWLSNNEQQTLASNRMELPGRAFRYARLVWREGKPIRFAAISAQVPVTQPAAAPPDSITLQPQAGRFAGDLVYQVGLAVPAQRMRLAFGPGNVVLPATLGHYAPLPAARGKPVTRWEFVPHLQATFYQFVQNGVERRSGEVAVSGLQADQWVLRAPGTPLRPALTVSWPPSTLVFMASGSAPYSLQVGRAQARAAQRPIDEVAPGLSEAELSALEQASTGPALAQRAAALADQLKAADTAGLRRKLILWGVLLLGVAVLAAMAWNLMRQMKDPDQA